MRKGHRRTQSANISYVPTEELPPLQQKANNIQNRNDIADLLSRCESKIKEKVCSVETLNTPLIFHQNSLFNFGKGIINPTQQQQQRDSKLQNIVVIPEKGQQPYKHFRRMPESELNHANRKRKRIQGYLKNTNKESVKETVLLRDVINKLMRDKNPAESLFPKQILSYSISLKHLPYHKKQFSNFT